MLKHTFRKKRTENRPKLLLLQLTLKLLTSIHTFVVHIYWLKSRTWDRFYLISKKYLCFLPLLFHQHTKLTYRKTMMADSNISSGCNKQSWIGSFTINLLLKHQEKEIHSNKKSLPPTDSLPKYPKWPGMDHTKAMSLKPNTSFPHLWQRPNCLSHYLLLPSVCISRSGQSREMLALRSRHADRGFEYFNHILNY